MIKLRKSADRGHANHGWLDSYHSFSFADYYDEAHIHFGPLRVINEDRIQAGSGFGTHTHRDMEIISYVIDGALAHKDSIHNEAVIRPGEVQRMTAGTGVAHSEYNHADQTTHFLQIWIIPRQAGLPPSYEQKYFPESDKRGVLRLVASPNGEQGSVTIHQDAYMYAGLFDHDEHAHLKVADGRLLYVHVVRGEVTVNDMAVAAGDALMLTGESEIHISKGRNAELLLFDLAASF
ncbi:pirin family protein [Dyella silvatica]|uniref:pirin family protein n=1 Tax=Dyella silvatica TaxID=2992128 RepID=UPI00225758AD|nr:pirin family protein [Dyella silvatica]